MDEKNAKDVFVLTKADALMIGRAAVGNPLIFKDLVDLEEGNPLTIRTYKDNLEILKEYIDYIWVPNTKVPLLHTALTDF